MTLTERIDAAEKWLAEARKRYWGQKQTVENLKPYKGEDDKHFKRRKAREKERLAKREDVKNHLAKKAEALKKLQHEVKAEHRDGKYDKSSTKIVTFDGVAVVESAAYWLQKSREHGWSGQLVSGFRTPEHCREICLGMCGAPTCPGRCAGETSNHCKTTYPGPAVDVTEYGQFEQIQFEIGSPLRNDLPIDPVHFSPSGH